MKCRCILVGVLLLFIGQVKSDLKFSPQDLTVETGTDESFQLVLKGNSENITIYLTPQHEGLVKIVPNKISTSASSFIQNIAVSGIEAGHVIVTANTTSPKVITEEAFIRITVQHSSGWNLVSQIVGWVYFAAWSISFYPQMYDNFKRKSVIGLNFDFLALNLVGFFLYSLFNVGLYWIPEVRDEYQERHPKGVNPVQVNDIVFAVHALVAVVLTVIQCYIYERGEQTVSILARFLLGIYAAFLGISLVLSGTDVIQWLDFLYYCSYVKLSITLIKYVPQAYMNYRRKSTIGWSIGNVFLDFTGGTLSMLQMIIISYNFNDWDSIFGDPTKFGLGLFSVIFDIFFLVQHYWLYRDTEVLL